MGRDWIAPPFHHQTVDWRRQAHLHRLLTDCARERIGESKYEADISWANVAEWLELRSSMKRRLQTAVSEDKGEKVEILTFELSEDGEKVHFLYRMPNGRSKTGDVHSEYVYDA